jgi:protein tyrosine phosphatase (PTP) superfamily phosphohydrolase (DUF442 family)
VPGPVVAPPAVSGFAPGPAPANIAGLGVQQGSYSSAFLDPFGRPFLDPGVRLAAPVPDGPRAARGATAPPGSPSVPAPGAPSLPPAGDEKEATPQPVDIPQFAVAKERVANGLQPFPDGITWLQTRRYRAALHIRAPGEDDSAARRQFERRNLHYISLEVSPNTLNRDVVQQFAHMVTDEANLPLFVYDKDGALAGGLWYLYYRTAAGMSDEKARSEAARLGFLPDQEGEQRTMWVAVQNYLRNNP